ncbi:MAG TPA: hypothetical protein DCR44_04875 [Acholeplasmatales bacterium]|nr:hypothetical protein [Acholeplasmatales bacterium]
MKLLIIRLVTYVILTVASLIGIVTNIVFLINQNAGWTVGQVVVFTIAFLAIFGIALHQGVLTAIRIKNAPKTE